MKTSVLVSIGLFDLEIRQDMTATAADKQSWSNLNDLATDSVSEYPYATYEPDFWLLDGNYKFKPAALSAVHSGWITQSMSSVDGTFVTDPVLTLEFESLHSTDGLSIHFGDYSGDYATELDVYYYGPADSLIRSDKYYLTGDLVTNTPVADFKKIVVVIVSTNRPYRYLRVKSIGFGDLVTFTGSGVQSATVIEEADMLSIEARYNTLELNLFSEDAAFSILNPAGYYADIQQRLPISVHEMVGFQKLFIGQYYLDTWESKSEKQINFKCIDLLGTLEMIPYRGDLWGDPGDSLRSVLIGLLTSQEIPYQLDPTLNDVEVQGWLPRSSYREMLQQLAFMAGAYVTCSRSNVIKISKMPSIDNGATETITRAQKGMAQSVSLAPLVTGVEVTAHYYELGDAASEKEYFNAILPEGEFTISLNEPVSSLVLTGADIVSPGVTFVVINVVTAGLVTLTARPYKHTTQVYGIYAQDLPSATKPNIIKITDATLVNADNVAAIAQRVYDHYQNRHTQKLRLYAPSIQVGEVADIETVYGQTLRAIVGKMSINLGGGMIADVELTGGLV